MHEPAWPALSQRARNGGGHAAPRVAAGLCLAAAGTGQRRVPAKGGCGSNATPRSAGKESTRRQHTRKTTLPPPFSSLSSPPPGQRREGAPATHTRHRPPRPFLPPFPPPTRPRKTCAPPSSRPPASNRPKRPKPRSRPRGTRWLRKRRPRRRPCFSSTTTNWPLGRSPRTMCCNASVTPTPTRWSARFSRIKD